MLSADRNTYEIKERSITDIMKITEDQIKQHVFEKLKILADMDSNEVLALFPKADRKHISKTLTELQKLCLARYGSHPGKETLKINNIKPSNSIWDHLKTSIRLFGNPIFLLICLARTTHNLLFLPVVTTIVDFSLDRGFQENEGSYIIAVLSAGDLIGRLGLGWVTDRGFLDVTRYTMVVMIIQGAVTASMPFMPNKIAICLILSVFGMLQGSLFVRQPILVHKYFGSHEQSIVMGCSNFFPGFLGLVLPIYIGYFRDTLGSYDGIFYINGAVAALVGLSWALEPYFLRCYPLQEEQTQPV